MDPLLSLAAGFFCAGLLLGAGWHKLRAPAAFRRALAGYELLPAFGLPVAARLLPLLEIALGAALLFPATRPTAAALACALFLLYALAMGVNLLRGRRGMDCGCSFGARAGGLTAFMPLRNLLFALTAALAAAPPLRAPQLADYTGATCAAAAFWLIALAAETAQATALQMRSGAEAG